MRPVSALSSSTSSMAHAAVTGRHRPVGRELGVPAHGPATPVERLTAMAVLVALGLRQFVQSGVTTGYLLAIVLCPVWIFVLRRFRGARLLNVAVLLTAVWGVVLRDIASNEHKINTSNQLSSTVLLLGILIGVNAIMWARTLLSDAEVGLFYGVGMLLNVGITGVDPANPWKTAFAIPLGVIALSLAARYSGPRVKYALLSCAVLVTLGAVSGLSNARSYAATFLIAGILMVWQGRSTTLTRRSSGLLTAGMLFGLAASTYWLGSKLLVSGYLGADAQARTVAQIEQSGSLILGGRPELEATLALMRSRPLGYGVGVEPNSQDILIAKSGLSSINYNPNNGYVEKFMFGGHIELHSVFGDLWASWGIPGLVVLALFATILLRSLSVSVALRQANPITVFLGVWSLWNLFFSPIYGSAPTLTLAIGLSMMMKSRRHRSGGDHGARLGGAPRIGSRSPQGMHAIPAQSAVPAR